MIKVSNLANDSNINLDGLQFDNHDSHTNKEANLTAVSSFINKVGIFKYLIERIGNALFSICAICSAI
jgi:hypothetical protein